MPDQKYPVEMVVGWCAAHSFMASSALAAMLVLAALIVMSIGDPIADAPDVRSP